MLDQGNKIINYIEKDQRDSLTLDHRYYLVGKLIKQDRKNPEPGYRETLICKECEKPMQVIGPNHFTNDRFMARCINDKCKASRFRVYARTVVELWETINLKAVQQVE
jgi:hypothetical protein